MASENANAQPQSIRLVFAKGTDVGRKRGHNEDYVDAFRLPDPEKRRKKGELFIVADGMGGHQAGEVASQKAVEAVSHEYYASPAGDVRGALVDAIEKANSLIYRLAQESSSRAGMGTTVVAAVVRGRELHLANVGDSRAYLLRNSKLTQVTRDHSFVQDQIEAGILTPEEARTHPQRNVVTRALGSKPDVKVDTFGGQLQPGDTLLLCTDGLSEHVQDEDIAAMLRQYPPKEAVPRLIALANRRGGSDNITALVLQAGSGERAAAVAGAPPREAAPTAPAMPAKADQGLSLALLAGMAAGGLILVAALLVGFFIGPRFLWGGGRETPQVTTAPAVPTDALPSPSPMPQSTATLASSGQVSTPLPAATTAPVGEPTVTPVVRFKDVWPPDGARFDPGSSVTFRWGTAGAVPPSSFFLLKTDLPGCEEISLGDKREQTCNLPQSEGVYEWWVELRSGDKRITGTDPRTLVVRWPTPTPTPRPTLTPVPSPTDTQPPPPPDTEPPSPPDTEPPSPPDTEPPSPPDTEPPPTDTEAPPPTDTKAPLPTDTPLVP